MITDADRRKLHSALAQTIGPEPSELLMELLPPTGWAHLATQQDIVVVRSDIDIAKTELRIEIQDFRIEIKGDMQTLRADVRTDMQALRSEMRDLRSELKGDMHDLRNELKGDMQTLRDDLTGELQEVREDVSDLASRVDSLLPKLVSANVASMVGLVGLVLAALSIA